MSLCLLCHLQINGFSNHQQQQHNGYQNPMNANQLGMMNPQMMNNPMMGHNMPMPNMPIHPQFFNNMPQQLPQFAMPNHINQLLPNLLGNLQFAVANSNLMGHSLPNFFQPSLEPHAFSSRPQLNSFNSLPYPPVPNPHQNHQSGPPGFSEPRPQVKTSYLHCFFSIKRETCLSCFQYFLLSKLT